MTSHLLLMLALGGPATGTPSPPAFATTPWTAAQLDAHCLAAVTRAHQPSETPDDVLIPELVRVRASVLASKSLTRGEQIRMRRRLDYVLEKALLRLQRKEQHLAKDRTSKGRGAGASNHALNGGAAEAARVRQLIDLIEMTIQPESWASNGGLGSIRYWAPGYALVIRNTQAVHEEIGGLRRQLGAQP